MVSRYAELDEAIMRHIDRFPSSPPIYSTPLLDMAAKALGRDRYNGDDKEWRLIDRRMQALKRSGRIAYRSYARWVVMNQNGGSAT